MNKMKEDPRNSSCYLDLNVNILGNDLAAKKKNIPIKGVYIKGVSNNEFQKDVKEFQLNFVKSFKEISNRVNYFYGPYDRHNSQEIPKNKDS